MSSDRARIATPQDKSLVEVRRKNVKMMDSPLISVFRCLSRSRIGHVGGQMLWNRSPDFGIIDCVACRSTDCDVKWQIPGHVSRRQFLEAEKEKQ